MSTEQRKEDPDRPIWGVEAIAAAANLTPRQTYHALEKGYLPASKAGMEMGHDRAPAADSVYR